MIFNELQVKYSILCEFKMVLYCNSHNLFGFIFLAADLCSSLQHLVFLISW